jgi:hypothetical protein
MRLAAPGLASLFAIILVTGGCAATLSDPMGKQNALQLAQREYTQRIRWGELERASLYVDPELRDAFLAQQEVFDSLRVTDYEIGEIEFGEDRNSAEVTVTYRAYSLATLIERPIREKQTWHRADGLANTWTLETELPEQLAAFAPAH